MGTGQVITNNGIIIALHRTFEASPSLSAPTKFAIGTSTTTPLVTDTTVPSTLSKNIDSGQPVITDATLNVSTQCTVLTTEANGNSITEFGLINTDGTPLLFSHAVFTTITKTTSVQIIVTEVDVIAP